MAEIGEQQAEAVLSPAVGVTRAKGFVAAAVHCGIRKQGADLTLIMCEGEASVAAVFTTNQIQAAPILLCREHLRATAGTACAIVVNAGNANACTGERGLAAARATAVEAARLVGIPAEQVLVASTGVIGQQLPVERLLAALPLVVAKLSVEGGADAAEAILTTDTRRKLAEQVVATAKGSYTVSGMAKGSGMIHPNMATTLGFVTTDAAVAPALLQACLGRAVERSFNRITVDGDTSTNDMVAVMASGASGVTIGAGEAPAFEVALGEVLTSLAKQVAADGEGATRLITVEVSGGRSEAEALAVARTIAGSPLVKTAVHGADANWGRVIAAAGRAGVLLAPERITVTLNGLEVLGPGYRSDFSEQEARQRLELDEVTIGVDLGQGEGFARTWTCDLTAGYIAINASYRS